MHHGKNILNGHKGDDQEFGVIDNPYYGDAGDIAMNPTRKSTNNVDLNNVEAVTVTENVYYEM